MCGGNLFLPNSSPFLLIALPNLLAGGSASFPLLCRGLGRWLPPLQMVHPPRKATVVSPGPPLSLKGVAPDGVPLGSCLRLPFLTSEEAQEGLQETAYLGS